MRADEVSVLDRIYATEARVAEVIARAVDYAKFVPGVDKSYRRDEGGVYVEMSLPIVTWASTWVLRPLLHAVDAAAVDGDLRGARVPVGSVADDGGRDARRVSGAAAAGAEQHRAAQAVCVSAVAAVGD